MKKTLSLIIIALVFSFTTVVGIQSVSAQTVSPTMTITEMRALLVSLIAQLNALIAAESGSVTPPPAQATPAGARVAATVNPTAPVITSVTSPVYQGEMMTIRGQGFTNLSSINRSKLIIGGDYYSNNSMTITPTTISFIMPSTFTTLCRNYNSVCTNGPASNVGNYTIAVANTPNPNSISNQLSFDVRAILGISIFHPADTDHNLAINLAEWVLYSTPLGDTPEVRIARYIYQNGETYSSASVTAQTWRDARGTVVVDPGRNLACGTLGDINNDGRIGQGDYDAFNVIMSGRFTGTDELKNRGDVDKNGSVGVVDGVSILRYINGLSETFPGCTTLTPTVSLSLNNTPIALTPFGAGLATVVAGQPMSLSWTSTDATSCEARKVIDGATGRLTGGDFDGQWYGSKTIGSGSQTITVPATMTPGVKSIGIQCINSSATSPEWRVVNGYVRVVANTQSITDVRSVSGSQVTQGRTYSIRFNSNNNVRNIIVRLSSAIEAVNSIYNTSTMSGIVDGSNDVSVTIPSNFPTGYAKLYVINSDNQNIFGVLEGYVTVLTSGLVDTAPSATFSYGGYTNDLRSIIVTQGSSAELKWSASNVASCEAFSNPRIATWTGNKGLSGSESFALPTTVSGIVTMGIKCRNAPGAEVASSVVAFEAKPVLTPVITLSVNGQALSTSPFGAGVQTLTAGSNMELNWTSVGADRCTAREVIENGRLTGGSFDSQWYGTKPLNASQTITIPATMTAGLKTIGIQCYNSAGWKVVNGYVKVVAPATGQSASAIDALYDVVAKMLLQIKK